VRRIPYERSLVRSSLTQRIAFSLARSRGLSDFDLFFLLSLFTPVSGYFIEGVPAQFRAFRCMVPMVPALGRRPCSVWKADTVDAFWCPICIHVAVHCDHRPIRGALRPIRSDPFGSPRFRIFKRSLPRLRVSSVRPNRILR
jgi:hypothetical protein